MSALYLAQNYNCIKSSLENKAIIYTILIALFLFIISICCIGSCSAATISFITDGDGAVAPEPITAEIGEYITLPTPTWKGHTFSSWSDSLNTLVSNKYHAGDRFKVTYSQVLYAVWVSKYTISFVADGDGAIAPEPITVDAGEYITLPTPTWEGHTFSSWSDSLNTLISNKYNAGDRFKVTSSKKLYAIWIKSYSQTFNGNANDVEKISVTADNGEYITIPSSTRENYTLKYWTTSSSDSGTRYYVGDSYKVSGSTQFYAQWEKNKITVSFDANGGSSVSPKTITLDTSFVLPGTSWFGNEFTGWYLNDVYIGKEGDTYKPTESVTLIARWNKGGIGTYLMYGGIIVIGIIILIIIVVILRRNKAKRQLQYQNNNGSDNKVINTEQRAKEIAEREKEAIINEANRKLALERKTAEERQREIDSIKYESEQKIAAEKKTAEEKQREIDSLKKQEPKQIIYHVHGDLHSENIGILAKDDAIVNHGKVSTGDNKDNSPKLFDEKEVNIRKCNNCGAEIKNTEALFCDKCGKKLR